MFEVQDLRFATLATVSRCGMVWFSEDVLSTELICENFLARMRHTPLEESEDLIPSKEFGKRTDKENNEPLSPLMQVGQNNSEFLDGL